MKNYEKACSRKQEIEKLIEAIWEKGELDAIGMYGDIFEWADSQKIHEMALGFIDKDQLDELEDEFNELNSMLLSYESAHGIK